MCCPAMPVPASGGRARSRASCARKARPVTGPTRSACTTTTCGASTDGGGTRGGATSRSRAPDAPRCSRSRRSRSGSRMKVTIVGGGSAQWVPILVDDIVITPCLVGAELVLEDVDAARLERTRQYAEHVAGLAGSGVSVRATTDLDDALTGADFVVVCISTGGLDSMARDLDVSEQFGIPLPIGDTVGPAGISRALRNVPVLIGIARAMERCCP